MTALTSTSDTILFPWGDQGGTLAVTPPDFWPGAEVIRPDLSGVLEHYDATLDLALDHPTGAPRMEELVRPGAKVAVLVDDPSRWTPVREALPAILRRLHAAGVRVEDVCIVAGVGRHHTVDHAAMRKRVGDDVTTRYTCFSPPVDDLSAYADLGMTPQKVPVRVFRPVVEADLRILIGSVLPHLQAGFGGGYKLIFPGASHRSTLGALHRQGISHTEAARLLGGDASENPMRKAIRDAAAMLGPCFSVSHLLGAPGQVLRVCAGHPDPVQDTLAAEARRRFESPLGPPADLIAAGNHPWPGDPLQSFKVLLQHRAACRVGGVLAGFFWTDSEEIDRSFPLSALRAIAATGSFGGWFLRRGLSTADRVAEALGLSAAFMVHWARELVVDRTVLVYAPPLFERIGPRLGPVRLFGDQAALWNAAAEALADVNTPYVRVFPQGGLTYAPATTRGEGGTGNGKRKDR